MAVTFNLTIGGVPCKELNDGSGKEHIGEEGGDAQRTFLMSWTNRITFAAYMIGGVTVDGGGATSVTPRQPHPSYSSLKAYDADIQGYGKPTGTNAWTYAKVTVKYKTFPFENQNQASDLSEESVDLSADVVTLKQDGFIFDNAETDPAKKKVERDVQKIIPTFEYAKTLYKVPKLEPVIAAAQAVIGKVGSVKGSAANSSMYMGFTAKRKTTTAGTEDWTVTHKFMIGTVDLRKEFNPQTGTWELIKTKVGGNYKYETTSFSGLGV